MVGTFLPSNLAIWKNVSFYRIHDKWHHCISKQHTNIWAMGIPSPLVSTVIFCLLTTLSAYQLRFVKFVLWISDWWFTIPVLIAWKISMQLFAFSEAHQLEAFCSRVNIKFQCKWERLFVDYSWSIDFIYSPNTDFGICLAQI